VSDAGQVSGQADRLLWMAAGTIAVVVFVTLAMIPFWPMSEATSNDSSRSTSLAPAPDATPGTPAKPAPSRETELLNRASLALEADMLLVPENVSAWSLFAKVLETDPDNAAAVAGLNTVADRLVERARGPRRASGAALPEPEMVANKILEFLPAHAGALALIDELKPRAAEPQPKHDATRAAEAHDNGAAGEKLRPVLTLANAPELEVNAALNDPVPEVFASFESALAAGLLTEPRERSAKQQVKIMRVLNPMHALTLRAEQELFEALMSRFEDSFVALDTETADDWLREANLLAVDNRRVKLALKELAFLESIRGTVTPLSEAGLGIIELVSPEYPDAELERGVEGWVDVEFTVTRDGSTRDVVVTGASHESTFTNEAVYAVTHWRFEPFRIRNAPIERRVRTRVTFVIDG